MMIIEAGFVGGFHEVLLNLSNSHLRRRENENPPNT